MALNAIFRFFGTGYVAFKEGLEIHVIEKLTDSEFLQQVSCGKLSQPSQELFGLSLYYYSFFKARNKKCCDKIFIQAYQLIYEATDYEFQNIHKINKRFSNCLFKSFVNSLMCCQRQQTENNFVVHFCPWTMTIHAKSINSDLQRGLDRRLRHTHP